MRVLPCHGHRNARVHRLRRRGERCRQRRAMKGWGNAMLWVTRHTIPDQSQRDRVADPALHRSCGDVSLRPGGGGPGAVPPRQGTSSSPPRISELDGRHAGPPPRSPSLRSSPADRRPARPGSRHRARCARARPRPRRRRRPPHRARAARRRDRRARGPRLWPPSPSRRPRSPSLGPRRAAVAIAEFVDRLTAVPAAPLAGQIRAPRSLTVAHDRRRRVGRAGVGLRRRCGGGRGHRARRSDKGLRIGASKSR